jgi:hypothetical protein
VKEKRVFSDDAQNVCTIREVFVEHICLCCVCVYLFEKGKIGFAFLATTTTTEKTSEREIMKEKEKINFFARINFKSRARSVECCENHYPISPTHNSTPSQY